MRFKKRLKPTLYDRIKLPSSSKLRGIFSSPIPYIKNVPSGDWTPYLTKNYEPQKWGWEDSDCCWCLSSVNNIQAQMNMLKVNGQFSTEALVFLQPYLDANGQFALSELFIEKLSGLADGGGTAPEAASLFTTYGMIPRSMLCYSATRASKWGTHQEFDADYFDPSEVTQAMRDMGKKFLQYVKIFPAQKVSGYYKTPPLNLLQAAFMQAPCNYGISIPSPTSLWNQISVPYTNSRVLVHEVLGVKTPNSGYSILDQYEPYLKTLADGYYIGFCNQIIVVPVVIAAINPVLQNTNQDDLWTIIFGYINGLVDLLGRKLGLVSS